MGKIEELNLILILIKKYSLPMSPILEYAIKEKMEAEEKSRISSNNKEIVEDYSVEPNVVVLITHTKNIIRASISKFSAISNFYLEDSGKDDFIEKIIQTTIQEQLLVFTKKGMCYWLKVATIPNLDNNASPQNISSLINIGKDDYAVAYINVGDLNDSEYTRNHSLFIGSKNGFAMRTLLEEYSKPRSNGIISMKIFEDDEIRFVCITEDEGNMYCSSQNGKMIIVPCQDFRIMRRNSKGIRLIRYDAINNEIVGMFWDKQDGQYLTVSTKGYLKITQSSEISLCGRSGYGMQCAGLNVKTGQLKCFSNIKDNQTIIIILKSGKILRFSSIEFDVRHRTAVGDSVIPSDGGEEIATVAVLNN